jgi:hypothetical protein
MQLRFSDGAHGALEGMFLRDAALHYCPEHKESAGW